MSFTNLLYHFVTGTKRRLGLLPTQHRDAFYNYIGGIIRDRGGSCLEIGGTSDHIHILFEFPTTVSMADEVGKIKASSSKWLNEQEWYRDKFRWQSEYGMFSVSESQVAKLKEYIRNQKEHHRNMTYREEFRKLLDQHDISYKEEYLPFEAD